MGQWAINEGLWVKQWLLWGWKMTTVLVAENVPVLILTPTANPEYFSVSYDDFNVHLEICHRCDPFFLKFCQFLIGSFFTTTTPSGWDSSVVSLPHYANHISIFSQKTGVVIQTHWIRETAHTAIKIQKPTMDSTGDHQKIKAITMALNKRLNPD